MIATLKKILAAIKRELTPERDEANQMLHEIDEALEVNRPKGGTPVTKYRTPVYSNSCTDMSRMPIELTTMLVASQLPME